MWGATVNITVQFSATTGSANSEVYFKMQSDMASETDYDYKVVTNNLIISQMLDKQGNEVSTIQSMVCPVEDTGGGMYSGYQKIGYYIKSGALGSVFANAGSPTIITEVTSSSSPITFRVLTNDLTLTQKLSVFIRSLD